MSNYPDPSELRAYSDEPMPFHDFAARDLELLDDNTIRVGIENVEYRYHPTYINVETARDEWHRASDFESLSVDHSVVFDEGMDFEIQEDFICVTGFTEYGGEDAQYNAYWILETVTITNEGLWNDGN